MNRRDLLPSSSDSEVEVNDCNHEIVVNHNMEQRRSLWRSISVEPVMFLYMLSYMLTSVVEEALFIDKACRINLGLPANICDHINKPDHIDDKKRVQLLVSNFHQYESIALHAVPMFLAMLLGVWSDKHGRKLPMLLGLGGSLFYALMIIVNIYQEWPLEVILYTATFPSAITGSSLAVFLAGFTYIADITTAKERTQRVTLLEVAYLVPLPTGVAIGSYLFTYVVNQSFAIMFSINAALMVLAIIYAWLTMEWKTNGPIEEEESSNCLLDIWNPGLIIESFHTVFRKRPDNRRLYLILIILSMGFYTFQRDEKHTVYLYTQLKFHWTLELYSHFRTFQSLLYVLGLLVGVPMLSKVLNLADTTVAIIGSLSHAGARLIFVFAQQPSLFYIGAAFAAYGPIVAPVLRSVTSKIVPASERGKAFSMLTVADTSVPVISGALYNQVYKATINTNPSAFYWVTIVSQVFVFLLMVIMHIHVGGKTIDQAEDTRAVINSSESPEHD